MSISVSKLVTVAPVSPPPSPMPEEKKSNGINFQSIVSPFIELLAGVGVALLITKSIIISDYCQRMLKATGVILRRLILPPPFKPTHPSFKKSIDQMESQVPVLQKRIEHLNQLFWKKHLVSRDVAQLKKLHEDIAGYTKKLDSYIEALEGRKKPFPIQPQLKQARASFKKLEDNLGHFCMSKAGTVIKRFAEAVEVFNEGGVELPKEIREPLNDTWSDLDFIYGQHLGKFKPSVSEPIAKELTKLKKILESLDDQSEDVEKSGGISAPLKLVNIGNSCYMDSALQALLCVPYIREKMRKVIELDSIEIHPKDPEIAKSIIHKKKMAIQQELLQFMDVQEHFKNGQKMTQMELFLFLKNGGPSLGRLREAIWGSEFHPSLKKSEAHIASQQDAAYIPELLIDKFIPDCKYNIVKHKESESLPGLKFVKTEPADSLMQLSLFNDPGNQKLEAMIDANFLEENMSGDNKCMMDPQDGIIIPGQEAAAEQSKALHVAKVDAKIQPVLKNLPPVLVIQAKRFAYCDQSFSVKKDNRPVHLPEDGIIDLFDYYASPEGQEKVNTRYRVKSFVRHIGSSANSGHYDAFVEINGKFFHCDDAPPKGSYKEISKEDFFNRKDAYLIVCEQISDEEVVSTEGS